MDITIIRQCVKVEAFKLSYNIRVLSELNGLKVNLELLVSLRTA